MCQKKNCTHVDAVLMEGSVRLSIENIMVRVRNTSGALAAPIGRRGIGVACRTLPGRRWALQTNSLARQFRPRGHMDSYAGELLNELHRSTSSFQRGGGKVRSTAIFVSDSFPTGITVAYDWDSSSVSTSRSAELWRGRLRNYGMGSRPKAAETAPSPTDRAGMLHHRRDSAAVCVRVLHGVSAEMALECNQR